MGKENARLLTPIKTACIKMDYIKETGETRPDIALYVEAIKTAQDARTASIKDAECQAWIERVKRELDSPCPHKTYPLEFRSKQYCELCWQEFWKKELGK